MIPDARFNAFVNRRPPAVVPGPRRRQQDAGRAIRTFANVDYYLSDFSTSPVPTVFMLKGNGSEVQETEIQGIRVGRPRRRVVLPAHLQPQRFHRSGWQRQYVIEAIQRGRELPEAPVVFQYVVHYADGTQQVLAPVVPGGRKLDPGSVEAHLRLCPAAAVAWTDHAQ
jgi:hypothetical protein